MQKHKQQRGNRKRSRINNGNTMGGVEEAQQRTNQRPQQMSSGAQQVGRFHKRRNTTQDKHYIRSGMPPQHQGTRTMKARYMNYRNASGHRHSQQNAAGEQGVDVGDATAKYHEAARNTMSVGGNRRAITYSPGRSIAAEQHRARAQKHEHKKNAISQATHMQHGGRSQDQPGGKGSRDAPEHRNAAGQ